MCYAKVLRQGGAHQSCCCCKGRRPWGSVSVGEHKDCGQDDDVEAMRRFCEDDNIVVEDNMTAATNLVMASTSEVPSHIATTKKKYNRWKHDFMPSWTRKAPQSPMTLFRCRETSSRLPMVSSTTPLYHS